jgi:CheY-like chemotaxis protein
MMNESFLSNSRHDILIVDDVPENLQILALMLKDQGYSVRPVSSGRMALKTAKANPPDLILLDITMPEMNGYEVCEIMKQDLVSKGYPGHFHQCAGRYRR